MTKQALLDDLMRRFSVAVASSDLGGRCLKFEFDEAGSIIVDGSRTPTLLHIDGDRPVDCTLSMSADTARRLMRREIDPTRAFMEGRLTFKGNVQAAMKMAPILRKASEA